MTATHPKQRKHSMSNTDIKHESSTVSSSTKLERWALFAEIAGAIAVVLSVAYLALQVSDNNRLLRSQAHYNALELTQRPLEIMSGVRAVPGPSIKPVGRVAAIIISCSSTAGSICIISTMTSLFRFSFGTAQTPTSNKIYEKISDFHAFGPNGKSLSMSRFVLT